MHSKLIQLIKKLYRIRGIRYTLILLYILIAGEIFLRVLNPIPILPRYITATYYGIRGNSPDMSYWHKTPEYTVNIRTNSKGIRTDQEIPYTKPKNTFRIIVLGDSFGMGYGVNLEDTFTQQLKTILENKTDHTVEIINLSSSGHGNAEELLALENEGVKYQPDLILLAWHPTDYKDNVRSNLFALESGKLVRKNKTYLPGVKIREKLFSISAYKFIAENSHLYNWLRENAARMIKGLMVSGNDDEENNNTETTSPAPDHKNNYREELTVALLKQIQEVAQQNNARFIVLDIPRRIERYSFESGFLKQENLPFPVVSPIAKFKQQGKQGKIIYWEKSHGHFTPWGCRLVAEALAETILKNNMIKKF